MYFVSLEDSMANNLIQYLLKFLREFILKVLYLLNKFNESKIFNNNIIIMYFLQEKIGYYWDFR